MGHSITGPYIEAGHKLRALRKARGYSHDRLAEATGTTRSHLIKLEKGLHKPGTVMTAALSEELRKNVESFYEVEAETDISEEEAALLDELLHFLAARRVARRRTHART